MKGEKRVGHIDSRHKQISKPIYPLLSLSLSCVIKPSKSYLILNEWSGDTGIPCWGNIDGTGRENSFCWRSRGFSFGGTSLRGHGRSRLVSFNVRDSKAMISSLFCSAWGDYWQGILQFWRPASYQSLGRGIWTPLQWWVAEFSLSFFFLLLLLGN